MVGDLVASEKKIEQVLRQLGGDRMDVAYGDTVMDIPLFEHTDCPIAVYPDEDLKIFAREHGWEIIGDNGSYS